MSDSVSKEDIILDWLAKLPNEQFDSRVTPDALLDLIDAMKQFGYAREQLMKNGFVDEVIKLVCHDWTPKAKTWKEVTRKKIKLAVAKSFPLDIKPLSDEDRAARLAAMERQEAMADYAESEEAPPIFPTIVRKPLDPSRYEGIDNATPMDEEGMLAELGLKKHE